ncbi:MAG: hypothetical protein HUK02_09570 [Bacteroidaceae bacterium]|nr:hypothetical protein [Bacteroidaceae bacterium]
MKSGNIMLLSNNRKSYLSPRLYVVTLKSEGVGLLTGTRFTVVNNHTSSSAARQGDSGQGSKLENGNIVSGSTSDLTWE